MRDETTLGFLKNLYNREGEGNRGQTLKRTLLSVAVPVTASLAMACYAAPPMDFERDCSDNFDDNYDGLVDCADSACASTEVCRGGCFDGVDNDDNGRIDCEDWSCVGTEGCLSLTGCSDGVDNDFNDLIDCDDPACAGSPECP